MVLFQLVLYLLFNLLNLLWSFALFQDLIKVVTLLLSIGSALLDLFRLIHLLREL